MKYIFPFLLILLSRSSESHAQSFSNSPDDSIEVNIAVNETQVLDIYQTNNSQDTIEFVWKKITEILPSDWQGLICDNRLCYLSLIDSGTSLPVLPGTVGWLSVHCYPLTTPGTAIIQYTIYDKHFPQLIDTLTWIINATPVGIDDISAGMSQIIFRDGRINYDIGNNEFDELSIVDIQGKIIYKIQIGESGQIEFPALPKSVYIIRLSGKKKQFVQKILN